MIEIHGGYEQQAHDAVSALREALAGKVVVDIKDELPTSDPGWDDHGNIVLVFDDGSELSCAGWGYDAWGPAIYYSERGEA